MEFENKEITCRFSVPDKLTVRQQMRYFSTTNFGITSDETFWEAHWKAAVPLIKEWKCDDVPDKNTSLDDMTDPKQAQIVIWAASTVRKFVNELENVPKN